MTEQEPQAGLPHQNSESRPNQFNREPDSDPLHVFETDTEEEGVITEEYIVPPEEDLEERDTLKQPDASTIQQKSTNSNEDIHPWVYNSHRKGAQAYAGRARSVPDDD